MPITVQNQPPFLAAGATGYDTGWNQGTAQRRKELWERQMEVARMQQAERMQQQQLAARQQSQLYDTAATQQRMMQQAALQRQSQLQGAAIESQQAQTQFGYQKELYGVQNQYQQQKEVAAHKQAVQDSMITANAELHQLVGGIDEANLTPMGRPVYDKIKQQMSQIQSTIESGDQHPEDLYVGVKEILGRASALKMPGMIQPQITPEEEIAKSTYTGPDGRIYSRDPKTQQLVKTEEYATVNGVPVGKVTKDQQSGNIGFYKKDGTFVPTFNKGEELRKIESEEAKAYDARASAIIKAEMDPTKVKGLVDDWFSPEKRQAEIAAGVQRRWSTLEQNIYKDFQPAWGGVPMAAPQGLPAQPAPQGLPGVPQPAPSAPAPQPTVTPSQPGGVTQPAPAAPPPAALPPGMDSLGTARTPDVILPHNPLAERLDTGQPANLRALRGIPLPNETVKTVLHRGQFDRLKPGEWFFHPETGEPVQKGKPGFKAWGEAKPDNAEPNTFDPHWSDSPFQFRKKQLNVKWIPNEPRYTDQIINAAPKIPANGMAMLRALSPGDYFVVVYPDNSKHLKLIPPDVKSVEEYLKDLQKNLPVR